MQRATFQNVWPRINPVINPVVNLVVKPRESLLFGSVICEILQRDITSASKKALSGVLVIFLLLQNSNSKKELFY